MLLINTETVAAGHSPTQLSQVLQWTARGGRKIRQVEQYLSLTATPLTRSSRTRGGG